MRNLSTGIIEEIQSKEIGTLKFVDCNSEQPIASTRAMYTDLFKAILICNIQQQNVVLVINTTTGLKKVSTQIVRQVVNTIVLKNKCRIPIASIASIEY
jgi:hypothetical protein